MPTFHYAPLRAHQEWRKQNRRGSADGPGVLQLQRKVLAIGDGGPAHLTVRGLESLLFALLQQCRDVLFE